jgi:hypothetical protein
MFEDGFGLGFCHDGGERRDVCVLDGLQAAEVLEQAAGGALANAGDLPQFGGAVANLAALAMEGDGEAVGFVADELHEVQNGIVMIENDGLVLLSADIDNFFTLGD